MSPIVSFVFPCYKLAHLLRECSRSNRIHIPLKTYGNFVNWLFRLAKVVTELRRLNSPRVPAVRQGGNEQR